MDCIKHFAEVETPVPGAAWAELDERKRVGKVLDKLEVSPAQFLTMVQVVTAKADGQVIVQLKQNLSASQRGPLLLDLEEYLKATVDEALTIWLEPLGDRNSLRNLRGIEAKA